MIGIIGFVLSLLWIYLLFKVGQKKSRTGLFYILLYAPLIITWLTFIIIFPSVFVTIFSILNVWAIIVLVVFIVERIAWGVTLRENSGSDELVWFYLVYMIPLFWFIYRIVKIR